MSLLRKYIVKNIATEIINKALNLNQTIKIKSKTTLSIIK